MTKTNESLEISGRDVKLVIKDYKAKEIVILYKDNSFDMGVLK